jgi:carboxymethylenebutenolidase
VLGLYAEKDGFVTPDVAKGVDKAIKDAGKSSEIHIYPGVDHGFFNDDRPDVHNKPAADDAWRRTLAFFRQHVK